jgi:hypothetical protein
MPPHNRSSFIVHKGLSVVASESCFSGNFLLHWNTPLGQTGCHHKTYSRLHFTTCFQPLHVSSDHSNKKLPVATLKFYHHRPSRSHPTINHMLDKITMERTSTSAYNKLASTCHYLSPRPMRPDIAVRAPLYLCTSHRRIHGQQ